MKLKKLFGGLLVFALVVSSAAVTPVKAADVTELAGLMGQYQVSTDGGEYNCTTQLWASNDVEISDPTKLTMSCDVYVPLASYEQIAIVKLYPHEFEKTPKKSIKRFLYTSMV